MIVKWILHGADVIIYMGRGGGQAQMDGGKVHSLPNLSPLELEFQVEYQTYVWIPSWIQIYIGIPSWIVDPLRECRVCKGYGNFYSLVRGRSKFQSETVQANDFREGQERSTFKSDPHAGTPENNEEEEEYHAPRYHEIP